MNSSSSSRTGGVPPADAEKELISILVQFVEFIAFRCRRGSALRDSLERREAKE